MRNISVHYCLSVLAVFCSSIQLANADRIDEERRKAQAELAPYFNRSFSVQAILAETRGPSWYENLFKVKYFGCPSEPAVQPTSTRSVEFTTSGPRTWAGDLDGLNLSISKGSGTKGGGLAVPSNSTARLPEDRRGATLEFRFDGTLDVKRALVDAQAEVLNRCFGALPPGSYSNEDIARLCPFTPVTKTQQGQTCVVLTEGVIGEPLADGSGYEAAITDNTLCDFIGYGRPENTNTGWTSCYNQTYRGVATVTSKAEATETSALLRSAVRKAQRKCAKARKKVSANNVQRCANREMIRTMAGK